MTFNPKTDSSSYLSKATKCYQNSLKIDKQEQFLLIFLTNSEIFSVLCVPTLLENFWFFPLKIQKYFRHCLYATLTCIVFGEIFITILFLSASEPRTGRLRLFLCSLYGKTRYSPVGKKGEVNCWLLTGFIRIDIAHLTPMLFAKINNPCGKTVTLWSYTELYRSGVWRPLQVGSLETCCV